MAKVGTTLSLSGRFAAQGAQAHRGLLLWAEDMNAAGGLYVQDRSGKEPIELVIHDDESKKRRAAILTERLIAQDKVDVLVGPYSSVLTLAAASVAERHSKVMWNHGGSSDTVSKGGFRFSVSVPSPASRYFAPILEMARTLGPSAKQVALLYRARGTFPRAVVEGAEAYAKENSLEVVLKAPYPQEPTGFAPLVDRVVACRPDVILGVGRTEEDLRLARELRAQQVESRVVGLVAAPIWLFVETLGEDANGFLGPSQWEPGVRAKPDVGPTSEQFVARFREHFGEEPDYPAAQAYAAGLIAQACIEAAGTLRGEPLREAADELAFTTFYGGFELDAATGEQIGHKMVVAQWQGGTKRVVWPPEVAEARPQVPG